MVISDMLYIFQHFNLNFIPFFIVNTVVFYITIVQHLRLDYCENFEITCKEMIDKLKWNMSVFFFKYHHVLSKHWQPSCSIVNVRMRRDGSGKRYLQE